MRKIKRLIRNVKYLMSKDLGQSKKSAIETEGDAKIMEMCKKMYRP